MVKQGFTLAELLVALVLVSMVFLGAISLYATGLKFLAARQAVDVSVSPTVSLEQIVRNISIANTANLTNGDSQLNLRLDFTCAGVALGSPGNTGDDSWWHYRFIASKLRVLCDNVPGTTVSAGAGPTDLLDNVNISASAFSIINPSASGADTVVSIHLVSTDPAITIDTEAALGAASKR